jgi:hypothetical protein
MFLELQFVFNGLRPFARWKFRHIPGECGGPELSDKERVE